MENNVGTLQSLGKRPVDKSGYLWHGNAAERIVKG
jgi:hypothetical protein